LWRTHERRRERLVAFARLRLKQQVIARGGSLSDIDTAKEVLDASALTIGFARRFATYKRATLIFRDIDRLYHILSNPEAPAQLIIAGKAHPQDEEGKKLIQEIVALSKEEHLRKKIVFLENYDMNIARYMVQGCDIWLNNPRRPLEASGTSGMKIIANGGLNLSVLDGWWDEGYDPSLGWRIGSGEEYEDVDYQDEVEFRLIYEALEKEILPLFYKRGDDKLPRGWIRMMKESMKNLAPRFNTNRMVAEYFKKYYHQAYENRKLLMADDWKSGKEFAEWKSKIFSNWKKIKFKTINAEIQNNDLEVGSKYIIDAEVDLGELTPKDVHVQVYYGKVDEKHIAHSNSFFDMDLVEEASSSKTYKYKGEIQCERTGDFGYTLRILPNHSLLINPFEIGLIKWADS
jgi:starch phosphorylase